MTVATATTECWMNFAGPLISHHCRASSYSLTDAHAQCIMWDSAFAPNLSDDEGEFSAINGVLSDMKRKVQDNAHHHRQLHTFCELNHGARWITITSLLHKRTRFHPASSFSSGNLNTPARPPEQVFPVLFTKNKFACTFSPDVVVIGVRTFSPVYFWAIKRIRRSFDRSIDGWINGGAKCKYLKKTKDFFLVAIHTIAYARFRNFFDLTDIDGVDVRRWRPVDEITFEKAKLAPTANIYRVTATSKHQMRNEIEFVCSVYCASQWGMRQPISVTPMRT